jgi:hypothetical protein
MPRTKNATTKTKKPSTKEITEAIHEWADEEDMKGILKKNDYADIDCLAIFCDNFDKLDYEAKVRVFAYITSRYSSFLPSQKIE